MEKILDILKLFLYFQISVLVAQSNVIEDCLRSSCSLSRQSDQKLFWSDKSTWTSLRLPSYGSGIIIDKRSWVIIDKPISHLTYLIVNGNLSILEGSFDINLLANYIQVNGIFEIINTNQNNKTTTKVILKNILNSTFPSRTIDVHGIFKATGKSVISTYYQLQETVNINQTSVKLNLTNDAKNWMIGNEIVFTPTAYYTHDGDVWYSNHQVKNESTPVEIRTITSIFENKTSSGIIYVINFSQPLKFLHLCESTLGESFCGYVGLLTRSVIIKADDETFDEKSPLYGHGGIINVYTNNYEMEGYIKFENVQFMYMGNVFDENGGIILNDDASSSKFFTNNQHIITGCSFLNTFETAIECESLYINKLIISNNLFTNVWSGVFEADKKCKNFTVTNNLVIGHYFPPKDHVDSEEISANYPIAAFSVFSDDGIFYGNKVAGSEDKAFAISQMFLVENAQRSGFPFGLCSITYTQHLDSSFIQSLVHATLKLGKREILMNEAVACKIGLYIISVADKDEDDDIDFPCGFVNNYKLWRNGRFGILSMDLSFPVVMHDTIMAENTVGISFNIYAPDTYSYFTGIINSKIIGLIRNDSPESDISVCDSLPDTKWPIGCLDLKSNILAGSSYHRVGIMLPQYLNAPQTCAFQNAEICATPYSVLRKSCMLPYEKRFGLPVSLQYAELHIYGNTFAGFCQRMEGRKTVLKTVAISNNPSQIDRFPRSIFEKNRFMVHGKSSAIGSSESSKSIMTGFDIFSFRSIFGYQWYNKTVCQKTLCLKRDPQISLVDLDGSTLTPFKSSLNNNYDQFMKQNSSNLNLGGQIIFNNEISLNIPSRQCFSISSSTRRWEKFVYCPKGEELFKMATNNSMVSKQNTYTPPFHPFVIYKAYWDDKNPTINDFFQVYSHPYNMTRTNRSTGMSYSYSYVKESLTVNGKPNLDSRFTYSYHTVAFSPAYEECSQKVLFNRKKVSIPDGFITYMYLLGSTPYEWVIRWSAPSTENAAVLKMILDDDDLHYYNVFIGDYPVTLPTRTEEKNTNGQARYVPSLINDYNCQVTNTKHVIELTLNDFSGTNTRDFSSNSLSMTIRGSKVNEFYTVKRVPMLIITINTTKPVNCTVVSEGRKILSNLLSLSVSSKDDQTKILRVENSIGIRGGSIISYGIVPSQELFIARTDEDRALQVTELNSIYLQVKVIFEQSLFQSMWKVDMNGATANIPAIPEFIHEKQIDELRAQNQDVDISKLRVDLAKHNAGSQVVLAFASVVTPPTVPTPSPSTETDMDSQKHGLLLDISSIITIAILSFLSVLGLSFAVILYCYKRKYEKGLMNTLVSQSNDFDVLKMMKLFGVDDFSTFIAAYTTEVNRLIDILFIQSTYKSASLTNCSQCVNSSISPLRCTYVSESSSEIIREMEAAMTILIRKSAVLGSKEIKFLLTSLQAKSKLKYNELVAHELVNIPYKIQLEKFNNIEYEPIIPDTLSIETQLIPFIKNIIVSIYKHYKNCLKRYRTRVFYKDEARIYQISLEDISNQLEMSHITFGIFLQHNRLLEIGHIYALSPFEKSLYRKVSKQVITCKQMSKVFQFINKNNAHNNQSTVSANNEVREIEITFEDKDISRIESEIKDNNISMRPPPLFMNSNNMSAESNANSNNYAVASNSICPPPLYMNSNNMSAESNANSNNYAVASNSICPPPLYMNSNNMSAESNANSNNYAVASNSICPPHMVISENYMNYSAETNNYRNNCTWIPINSSLRPPPLQRTSVRQEQLSREVPYDFYLKNSKFVISQHPCSIPFSSTTQIINDVDINNNDRENNNDNESVSSNPMSTRSGHLSSEAEDEENLNKCEYI